MTAVTLFSIVGSFLFIAVAVRAVPNPKVAGVIMLVGAVLVGAMMQFLGPGLITSVSLPAGLLTNVSLPVPPPVAGRPTPSSIVVTSYHWPLLPCGIAAIAGFVCLLLPSRYRLAGPADKAKEVVRIA